MVLTRTEADSARIGVRLTTFENEFVVRGIDAGPVSVWNNAHPMLALRLNDCITAVNGVSGTDAMDAQLLSALQRRITFVRYAEDG